MEEEGSPEIGELPQWPPVSTTEVKHLIQTLKIGKAPGTDLITPELIKKHLEWWVPVIAALFTALIKPGKFLRIGVLPS